MFSHKVGISIRSRDVGFFLHFLKGLIIWVVIGIVNGRDTCKYDTRADYERSLAELAVL